MLAEAVTIRDPDGHIVYANQTALTSMGFGSLDELRSRTSLSIMDDYVVEDERGRPLTLQDVPSVRMMHGKSAPPVLMRVVHKESGEANWRLLKTTAMRDERSQFLGAMTVIEDVTPVKTAEVHTRVLAESGRILASSLDYQRTLGNIAEVAVPSIADYCSVDLLDDNGRLDRVAAAHRNPAQQGLAAQLRKLAPEYPQPANPGTRVLETGTSELFGEVTDGQLVAAARGEEHLALLRALEIRSLLMVPMRVPSHTIGLMTLATAESPRRLSHADVELAEQLAQRAAVAVENSRLHTATSPVKG